MKAEAIPELRNGTNGAARMVEYENPYVATCAIEGSVPILFHAWNCESVEEKSKAKKGSQAKKTDDVESFIYRDEQRRICVPGIYIHGALIGAARFQQDPRSPRKSAMELYKAAVVPLTLLASLGTEQWDFLDKRRVVIQRSAVTRTRPGFHAGWRIEFELLVNLPEYVRPVNLLETLSQAGRLIGIGDYRPTYGRFNVVKFETSGDN